MLVITIEATPDGWRVSVGPGYDILDTAEDAIQAAEEWVRDLQARGVEAKTKTI
jgi:hypothetical protein